MESTHKYCWIKQVPRQKCSLQFTNKIRLQLPTSFSPDRSLVGVGPRRLSLSTWGEGGRGLTGCHHWVDGGRGLAGCHSPLRGRWVGGVCLSLPSLESALCPVRVALSLAAGSGGCIPPLRCLSPPLETWPLVANLLIKASIWQLSNDRFVVHAFSLAVLLEH